MRARRFHQGAGWCALKQVVEVQHDLQRWPSHRYQIGFRRYLVLKIAIFSSLTLSIPIGMLSGMAGDIYDRLCNEAQVLMLRKGYPSTGVDEICKAAGVTKGSFYHHFASKEALAVELIDRFYRSLEQALGAGDFLDEADVSRRCAGFLNHSIRLLRGAALRDGCLLGSFALDLAESNPEIQKQLSVRFDSMTKFAQSIFAAVDKERPLPGKLTPKRLARQYITAIQGGIVLAKAHGNHKLAAEEMVTFQYLVDSVFQ